MTDSPTKPSYPASDPYGHITEALVMGDSFQGARDLFLAWVLRLPENTSPNQAADQLLEDLREPIAEAEARGTSADLMELIAMVREARDKPVIRPQRRGRSKRHEKP